jgi:glutamine synthetase adenylyltransferase
MTDSSDEAVSSAVYRVAVRLPSFWPDRQAIWFAQAEAQFELASITRQRIKFSYVISHLTQQQAAEVEDIITSPPEQDPYDGLKEELVRRLSTSREQRVRQLLSHEEIGDQKPSQFLRHLKGLAPDVPDDFLRTIWASRLPTHVQVILARQTEGSLESASRLADRICEVTTLFTTASISPSTPDSTVALMEHMEELSRQMASLRASQTHRLPQSRGRHHSQSRHRRHNTSDNPRAPRNTCWYHWKFRNGAQKCTPPCSHQQSDTRQQENSTSGR